MTRRHRPDDDVVVAGRRPVREALRAGRVSALFVDRSFLRAEPLRRLAEEAERHRIPVRHLDAHDLDRLAQGPPHQGVVARVRLPAELGEADLAGREWPGSALALVLDGVTDPQNLGAAARGAEAAGASVLVSRRHRGAAVSAAAVRASAGALLHLPMARVANIGRAIQRLQEAGFWSIGLDADAPRRIDELDPPDGRLAVVAGAEGPGLSRLVRERCDELASIPMLGRVDSLNVAVASALALYVLGPMARKN